MLCQRWIKRLSKSACAISVKRGATGLAAVTQSHETPFVCPLLPDLPASAPHPEGMDSILLPSPRPWHLPMQNPEQERRWLRPELNGLGRSLSLGFTSG